ncbi:MAG: hypothetical protein ACRDIB_10100 [Ardenticatenaceae bacterium]
MDTVLALLLNIVYGFLFFLAFAVMIGTFVLFALALWNNAVRPVLNRLRSSRPE